MRTTSSAKLAADLKTTLDRSGTPSINEIVVTKVTDGASGLNPHLIGIDPVFHAEDPWFPIEGTEGNDDLDGTALSDIINGNGGHDNIYGAAGNDQINGGAGMDWLVGDSGNDYLYGGADNDTMWGDTNPAEAPSDGDDVLSGGDGDDNMYGQGGDDMLIGGTGENEYYGGTGDDLLIGSHSDDRMWGNAGADRFADIGVGDSNITVFDYNAAEGDQVDGVSYEVAGGSTLVYDAGGDLKFTLFGYDADANGISFFNYELEPAA